MVCFKSFFANSNPRIMVCISKKNVPDSLLVDMCQVRMQYKGVNYGEGKNRLYMGIIAR